MSCFQQSTASVPQGFSVYQPMLGAPLQFFPALGTKHLDDLMDAYFPGPASIKEKRATISLDFLDHIQRTGETFKFYAVAGSVASPESPASVSTSSINVSPVTSNWDWSSVSGASSQASRKASVASSRPQATAADFSHMPGMKIMTKEGVDVTNSASRGSKTKEQRDHAHLMRIIKACDSCRRKKVKCDPSHKKRGAASPATAPATSKVAKKTKTPRPEPAVVAKSLPVALQSAPPPAAPSIDFDFSLTSDLDAFMPLDLPLQPWEDFMQYPLEGIDENYDFFFDPEGYVSSESPVFSTPDSKSISPTSVHDHVVAGLQQPYAASGFVDDAQLAVNATAAADFDLPINVDYTDFNLFSPRSDFSEDDRMLSVASATPSAASVEAPEGPAQGYPGATPSPVDSHDEGAAGEPHGTLLWRSERDQLVVGEGQNHNRLLCPFGEDEAPAGERPFDRLHGTDLGSLSSPSVLRHRSILPSGLSEEDARAISPGSASFADSFGSDGFPTPALSESSSSIGSSHASQSSSSIGGLDGHGSNGVDPAISYQEISRSEVESMRRSSHQEAAYASDQLSVGEDEQPIMHAVFATAAAQDQSSTASSSGRPCGSGESVSSQLPYGVLAASPNANMLRSAAAANAAAAAATATTTASPADRFAGLSSGNESRVLLSLGSGASTSKLRTGTLAPLSSKQDILIGAYGMGVLMEQAILAWRLLDALATASATLALCVAGGSLLAGAAKQEAWKSSPSLPSSVESQGSRAESTTTRCMQSHAPLLGHQVLLAT